MNVVDRNNMRAGCSKTWSHSDD